MTTQHKGSGSHRADVAFKMPKIDFKTLDLQKAFQQFLHILKFDKSVIIKVSKDENGGAAALVFVLIGAVVVPLANLLFGIRRFNIVVSPDIGATFLSIIVNCITVLLAIFITSFVAVKLFEAKNSFAAYFRVAGLFSGLNVVNVVGGITPGMGGMLISLGFCLWVLVFLYFSIKTLFHLDDANTVIVIIITVISFVVLESILNGVFGLSSGNVFNPVGISMSY